MKYLKEERTKVGTNECEMMRGWSQLIRVREGVNKQGECVRRRIERKRGKSSGLKEEGAKERVKGENGTFDRRENEGVKSQIKRDEQKKRRCC